MARRKKGRELPGFFSFAIRFPPPPNDAAACRALGSLGEARKHWFRAKFFPQYRLFFRYHLESRIIVYAWVNQDDTKRAYASESDAYRGCRKMLDGGAPDSSGMNAALTWRPVIDDPIWLITQTPHVSSRRIDVCIEIFLMSHPRCSESL